jgi:hypothetical protein
MVFSAICVALLALITDRCNGYSLYDPKKAKILSQKSVLAETMSMTTQRDTIRMPSGAPMVPYKVSFPRLTNCLLTSH